MKFNLLVLLFLGLCLCAQQASAGNPDILWQKTLTADTLPIRSIAIAEGKYVAALKGNQIIILDYATGDSVTAFATPKEMYGNDIILGKNGERLYVLLSNGKLRSWDIATGEMLKDVVMIGVKVDGSFNSLNFTVDYSLDGKRIAVMTIYTYSYNGAYDGGGQDVLVFTTIDSSFKKSALSNIHEDILSNHDDLHKSEVVLAKTADLNFSPSGNYLLNNRNSFTHVNQSGPDYYSSSESAYFTSFSKDLKSYQFKGKLPNYIVSSDDGSLLYGNKIMDLPPVHTLRTITKTGFVFLPDDNHLLAFKAGGGIAAISNIEQDTWEKVFYGDSLTENLIQTNASRSAFATATNGRITLWKIPDTLQAAHLKVDFTMSKDTIQIYDSVVFTNSTLPLRRRSRYEWDFGDGSPIDTTVFPVHTFKRAGNLTVTLSVRDTLGQVNSISKTIFVDFPFPNARFTTLSDTAYVVNMVAFTNQSTPERPGTHYSWDFGDGSALSQEVSPVHQFLSIGNYSVKLVVRDTLGRTSSFSKQLLVLPQIVPSGGVWTNHFHTQRINSLAYSPDGGMIITGSDDGYARAWEGMAGKQLFTQKVGRPVYSTLFTKDGASAYVASYDLINNSPVYVKGSIAKFINYMDRWDFAPGVFERRVNWDMILGPTVSEVVFAYPYLSYRNNVLSNAVSENGMWYIFGVKSFVTFSSDTKTKATDSITLGNRILYNISIHKAKSFEGNWQPQTYWPAYGTVFTPDSKMYLISRGSGLFAFDVATDSILKQFPIAASATLRFSPDKYYLLTNTGLWDIYADTVLVKSVTLPQVFEFHPDGIHVFTIRPDSTIGIFNLSSNSYDYLYSKQPVAFTCLAVAPDGKHIATGDNSGYITVWKVPDTLKSAIKIDFQALSFKRSAVKTSDTVEFANTTLPANNSFDYSWNFGDGTTSTERAPKHRYLKPGKYTVSLTAYTNGNVVDSISKTQYITVTGPIGVDESQVGLYSTALSITPNPSYAETQIHLTLAQACDYNVRIIDNLGREIARWDDHQSAGEHVILWNENVPSGVYYCTLSVGGEVRMVSFVVVR